MIETEQCTKHIFSVLSPYSVMQIENENNCYWDKGSNKSNELGAMRAENKGT